MPAFFAAFFAGAFFAAFFAGAFFAAFFVCFAGAFFAGAFFALACFADFSADPTETAASFLCGGSESRVGGVYPC
ncbi:MAG TPA: hypothetical protein VGU23_08970, partial [Acidobacteriaceae bacterium]|nr:hypothetical protein [Acidobacteriaceae bacterium]